VLIDSELQCGTTVTIYLPKSCEPFVQPHVGDRVEPRGKRSGTILVVEDNLDVRGVATSLLQQLGYDTLEVDSARAALERLYDGAKVNLIFSDIVLPGAMDGLALAAELETRYPRMPILLTTGYARSLASEPRYPVLRKPYDIVQLDDAIKQAMINNRRLGGELSANSQQLESEIRATIIAGE
jgi:CheY-like chemotaxis protein